MTGPNENPELEENYTSHKQKEVKTVEELQVAAARIEERGTLREKAVEVATPRTLWALESAEGKERRMTLRRKKLKAFLERGREGDR